MSKPKKTTLATLKKGIKELGLDEKDFVLNGGSNPSFAGNLRIPFMSGTRLDIAGSNRASEMLKGWLLDNGYKCEQKPFERKSIYDPMPPHTTIYECN